MLSELREVFLVSPTSIFTCFSSSFFRVYVYIYIYRERERERERVREERNIDREKDKKERDIFSDILNLGN